VQHVVLAAKPVELGRCVLGNHMAVDLELERAIRIGGGLARRIARTALV